MCTPLYPVGNTLDTIIACPTLNGGVDCASNVIVITEPFPEILVVVSAATLDTKPTPIIPMPATIPTVLVTFNVVS